MLLDKLSQMLQKITLHYVVHISIKKILPPYLPDWAVELGILTKSPPLIAVDLQVFVKCVWKELSAEALKTNLIFFS
jgi:hypothetical protein